MLFIALKRLVSRFGLTLLSILGVTLSIALVASIPIFSKAVSFVMLKEELNVISTRTGRPLFSMRVYVLPSARYPLPLEQAEILGEYIEDAITNQVGLPLVSNNRHLETTGLIIRTRDEENPYGEPNAFLRGDTNLVVLPGAESRLDIVEGDPMEAGQSTEDELAVWMHKTTADQMGLDPGEKLEIRDLRRGVSIPIRVAGFWQAANPKDVFWFSNPDMGLRGKLLVMEEDYQQFVEPAFESQLGFASWYLILDENRLAPEQMQAYADGMDAALKLISGYLPDTRVDSSPMEALDNSIERESKLTSLLFVFSVPVIGFLLYFLALISNITIRWQRRETAVMVSRGMRQGQLMAVALIETIIIVGIGLPLGILSAIELARLMGYTESFMVFTWRAPLPVSPTSFNVAMVAITVLATFLARLWPTWRATRTSVVAHERRRARAPDRPFWQRYYLDFALLIPVIYAYRQLSAQGTLVPQVLAEGEQARGSSAALLAIAPKFLVGVIEFLEAVQDPLLFLVPALFTLACSLILVRIFPLLMRIGDWLGGLGRQATPYLAFRQLSRQSNEYTSALLLVITSLSLGAFMASMALSLDSWLIDQVHYAVGADVLIKQTTNPDEENPVPTEGAWVLPVDSYLEVPGVLDAARIGMYPASIDLGGRRSLRGQFIGVDRLDAARVAFYRPDFDPSSMGALMNALASREDAILVSETALARSDYEVGDKVHIRVTVADVPFETDFTIAGTFSYFPMVYEEGEDGQTAVIGNLNFLFDSIGATLLHNIWLRVEPDADQEEMIEAVEKMGVFISRWVDSRDEIAEEQARVERVGIFGVLTIGFFAAAALAAIGLLVYNYASLEERLFRFTILRAVGLSLTQVVGQVSIEYLVLMVYSVLGGALIGIWASSLFIPFFQATDRNVLRPPRLVPLIASTEIGRISAAFVCVLVVAQVIVIYLALRRGVFQALRMGDRE